MIRLNSTNPWPCSRVGRAVQQPPKRAHQLFGSIRMAFDRVNVIPPLPPPSPGTRLESGVFQVYRKVIVTPMLSIGWVGAEIGHPSWTSHRVSSG